jgi:hypothetical protein
MYLLWTFRLKRKSARERHFRQQNNVSNSTKTKPAMEQSWRVFCLPGEAGKPGHLKEDGVTPTEGKTIRLARASLANGGV